MQFTLNATPLNLHFHPNARGCGYTARELPHFGFGMFMFWLNSNANLGGHIKEKVNAARMLEEVT